MSTQHWHNDAEIKRRESIPSFQGTANQRPSVRWLVPSALRAAAAPELLRWTSSRLWGGYFYW